jgi:hypothetical protein
MVDGQYLTGKYAVVIFSGGRGFTLSILLTAHWFAVRSGFPCAPFSMK